MGSLRMLLVEDSPSDVRLIREALKQTPLQVQITLARDGVKQWTICANRKWD